MKLRANEFQAGITRTTAPRGTVVRPMGAPIEDEPDDDNPADKGADMPRGHYVRKKKHQAVAPGSAKPDVTDEVAPPNPTQPVRRKAAARTKTAPAPEPATARRFGVFEDGSLHISTDKCKGELSREEAGELLGWIEIVNRTATR